jgi:putative tricarboxylic transport membrane protein
VILGPLAEANFMTTMISFENDWTVFFTRPVASAVMTVAIITLIYPLFRYLRQQHRQH